MAEEEYANKEGIIFLINLMAGEQEYLGVISVNNRMKYSLGGEDYAGREYPSIKRISEYLKNRKMPIEGIIKNFKSEIINSFNEKLNDLEKTLLS